MTFHDGPNPTRPYRDPGTYVGSQRAIDKHKPIVYPESVVIGLVLVTLAFGAIVFVVMAIAGCKMIAM